MISSVNWDLQVDPSVYKILRKVPRNYAETILAVIKLLPLNPYFGDIEKLKGTEGSWRRRIGQYRIFYKIKVEEKIILVFHLERRTSKTY